VIPEVDRLVAAARSTGAPVAAIELAWDLEEGDGMAVWWVLELRAVVESPGPDHSRYRSVRLTALPATSDRAPLLALVRAVADALAVPLELPDLDDEGARHGSRWIERQAPAPAARYDVQWALTTWSDAGAPVSRSGVTPTVALSGTAACTDVAHRLEREHDASVRPVSVRCVIAGVHAPPWHTSTPRQRPDLPRVEEIRSWRRDGAGPAAIATSLRSCAPAVTPLAIMLAFEAAFALSLDELTPLAAWAAGQLDDRALDTALAPRIAASMPAWDRPGRLRAAHAAGASIAALLRADLAAGANAIYLMKDLCDTFRISLRYAKEAVVTLGAVPDTEIDSILAAAMAGRP
jgi:hypothetical protein